MEKINKQKKCSPINTLYIKGVDKMKKIVFLIFACVILFTGCIYQVYDRPKYNDSEVWICEEPYAEFYRST